MTGLDVEAEVDSQLVKILERIKNIPKGKKVYEGPEGICFASDHLYWYDGDFNEIDPPDEINGYLNCALTKITSLEGCPKTINGDFNCSSTNITSLEGCPRIIRGGFSCSYTKISSLKGAPEGVGGNFYCSVMFLTSLKGAPEKVGGNF